MKNHIVCTSNGIIGTKFPQEFINKNISKKSIIVVDNASYGTSNYNKIQENIEQFYKYTAKNLELITIDKSNIEKILNHDVCYVMGGSIANLVEMIHTTNIKDILKIFLENSIYIGESSGSIILDEDVEWYFDLKRGTKAKYNVTFENYKGLGFINQHIYPHYNKEEINGINKILNYNEEIITLNDGDYIEYSTVIER